MARTLAARRWRGLAALAPLGALLALAPTTSSGALPSVPVQVPVQVPVHVPDVPNVPGPAQGVTTPVTGSVNSAKDQLLGQGGSTGGTHHGGGGGPSSNGGGGQPGSKGGGPNGSDGGRGGGSGGGGGGGAGAGGGGFGGARGGAALRRARVASARSIPRAKGSVDAGGRAGSSGDGSGALRPIRDVIRVIPGPVKALIAALA